MMRRGDFEVALCVALDDLFVDGLLEDGGGRGLVAGADGSGVLAPRCCVEDVPACVWGQANSAIVHCGYEWGLGYGVQAVITVESGWLWSGYWWDVECSGMDAGGVG